MLTPREKSSLLEIFPSEDGTHDAQSSKTVSPAHNQLSYSGPRITPITEGAGALLLVLGAYDYHVFQVVIP